MILWLIVPLTTLAAIGYSLWARSDRAPAECALLSLLGGSMLVAASTELLSLFNAVAAGPVRAVWAAAALGALIVAFYSHGRRVRSATPPRFPQDSRVAVAVLAGVALITGLTALISPPNNIDSLTYHMPRVMHWMEHNNVRHYPTESLRQLYMAPFAEFCIMHLYLLTDGDRFSNFVQWIAMLGCWAGVAAIAGRLGADRREIVLAVLLCAVLPMGICQAATTQNDFVTSFFIVAAINFALSLIERVRFFDVAACGVAVGLAAMTKPVAGVWLAPFGIWLAVSLVRRVRVRAVPVLALLGLLAAAPSAPHYGRNYALFGTPLAPTDEPEVGEYRNRDLSLGTPVSNLVRNAALHLALPWDAWNDGVVRLVSAAHRWVGQDPEDPDRTWHRTPHFQIHFELDEDLAGNFLHWILALGVVPAILMARRLRRIEIVLAYLCACTAGFVLFCWALRWQPWNTRLHLPWFVMACPLIARTIGPALTGVRLPLAAIVLFLAATPWLGWSARRPLLGNDSILVADRTHVLFSDRPERREKYNRLIDQCARTGARHVCLVANARDWEYPLWVLLRERLGPETSIEHIRVRNGSRKLTEKPRDCDFVIQTRAGPAPGR